jgi:hypothetical protein
MRFLSSIGLLAALFTGACNASVKTTGSAGGPSPPATSPAAPPTPAAAVQTPRPTSKAGCDACKGLWAKHGIADTESCICKTKDGGKTCRDGAECEGTCLVSDDAKFEVAVPGPPPKGSFAGKCSEYDTAFGCHRMIARGTGARGPVTEEEAAERLCVD